MRAFFKDGDDYYEVFQIDFRKGKDMKVIGENLLLNFLTQLIPTGRDFHTHVNYVSNGNLHVSMKYYDVVEQKFIDRKIFHNHIAIRKNDSPEFDESIPYERRDRIADDPLDMFMMNELVRPWDQRPFAHAFGTSVFNFEESNDLNLKRFTGEVRVDEDLIVDYNECKGKTINFMAGLFDEENRKAFTINDESLSFISKEKKHENLILQISALVPK